MLIFHDGTPRYEQVTADLHASALPAHVGWIDIVDGDKAEIEFIERATGQHVPTLAELKEIENSSRLRFDQTTFCLSTPLVTRDASHMPHTTPIGLILTKDLLITIRFSTPMAFSTFAKEYGRRAEAHADAVGAFVGLMDALVDRAADVLEEVGNELDIISQNVFSENGHNPLKARRPAHETINLRSTVHRIGRNGDLASKIRDSLLGLARIVTYVGGNGAGWFSPELRARLETQRHDIASLSDYDAHLLGKVQLLLEATMGLINIEQNNIIKVLTIVSVVGVPPTLVASMYGMNFRHMPELDWVWGYPYGLALIALSAIVPVIWFRVRGWL